MQKFEMISHFLFVGFAKTLLKMSYFHFLTSLLMYKCYNSKIGLTSQQKAAHSSASAVSAVLPAYCDPPNPCPLGYTSADGCIEGDLNYINC